MDPVNAIRRLGFRKWYDRQLIDSHMCLVTCLLCGITIAAMVEEVHFARLDGRGLTLIGVALAAMAIGWLAWRRYITVLGRAELYGERSTCEGCNAYGRFDVIRSGQDTHPGAVAQAVAPLEAAWMEVRCRKCQRTWRMPE